MKTLLATILLLFFAAVIATAQFAQKHAWQDSPDARFSWMLHSWYKPIECQLRSDSLFVLKNVHHYATNPVQVEKEWQFVGLITFADTTIIRVSGKQTETKEWWR